MELNVRIAALVSVALWTLSASSVAGAVSVTERGAFVDMECWEEEVTPAPSVTDTVVPTLPPVITVVPTPEPTETPRSSRIYVPLIDNGCEPWRERASVVLVLDMSTSMYRETRAGRSKHEAALEAAHRFTDLMQPGEFEGGRFFRQQAFRRRQIAFRFAQLIPVTGDKRSQQIGLDILVDRQVSEGKGAQKVGGGIHVPQPAGKGGIQQYRFSGG